MAMADQGEATKHSGGLRTESAASTASTANSLVHSSGSMSCPQLLLHADVSVRSCGYCANAKLLRHTLPAKKCDYCFKYKCQFCTLKFPLLNVKKALPKSMKSNSRICLSCFSQQWQENGVTTQQNRKLKRGESATKDTAAPQLQQQRLSSGESADSQQEPLWQEASPRAGRESFDEATLAPSRDSLLADSFHAGTGASAYTVTKQTTRAGVAKRLAQALGLVVTDRGLPKPQVVVHVVELWMSMLTAAILLAVALVEELPLPQRVCVCVGIYGVFLALHPWIHNVNVNAADSSLLLEAAPSSTSHQRVARTQSEPVLQRPPSTKVPEVYRDAFQHMQALFSQYTSDKSNWKLIKSTTGGKIYEVLTDAPQTVIMLDMFVAGLSTVDFITFMNRTAIKDRAVWDWNIAAFEVVEEFPDDDTCIIYNAQKPFLGGLVSARDFCLLYKTTPNAIIYRSVVHPMVPARAHATRGTVFLAGFHCTPATNDKGEDGFMLKYVLQVDIGGSIPTRLQYNGTVDNMEKMIKTFRQAKKLFAKESR